MDRLALGSIRDFGARVCAALAVLFCVSMAAATTPIQIRATDDANHPLAHVRVEISSHGRLVESALTNSSGRAEFAALPDGAYDIAASRSGFQLAVEKNVAVRNG